MSVQELQTINESGVVGLSPTAKRLRHFLTVLMCFLSALQGATWAMWASVPLQAQDLFGFPVASSTLILTWTINSNNIAQALTTPLSTWLVYGKSGLRRIMMVSSAALLCQQLIWAAAALFCQNPHQAVSNSASTFSNSSAVDSLEWSTIPVQGSLAAILLCVGAVAGGASSAFTQGAVSRFSAEWFEPEFRTRVTSTIYVSTYFGQTLSVLATLCFIHTAKNLAVFCYVACGVSLVLCVTSWLTFPNNPSNISKDSGCPGRISHLCCSQKATDTSSFVSTLDEPFMVADTNNNSGSMQPQNPIADATCGTDNGELRPPPHLSFLQGVLRAICGLSCMMLMLNGALLNGVYNMWQSAFPLLLSNMSTEQFAQNQTTAKLEEIAQIFGTTTLVTFTIGGFFIGQVADRCFVRRLKSLLIETAFPVPEGTTANIATLLMQLVATIFGVAFNSISTFGLDVTLSGVGLLCTLALVATPVQYARLDSIIADTRSECCGVAHRCAGENE
eukprot:INCI8805.2.p1 GENE.INCI8805.2~~INCI8805.2.p1  ORF type:complete len:504 (-),score=54.16 INCI8805.2:38-1549(-)